VIIACHREWAARNSVLRYAPDDRNRRWQSIQHRGGSAALIYLNHNESLDCPRPNLEAALHPLKRSTRPDVPMAPVPEAKQKNCPDAGEPSCLVCPHGHGPRSANRLKHLQSRCLASAKLSAPIGLDQTKNFDKAKNRDRLIRE
jgi:hypothetical protein